MKFIRPDTKAIINIVRAIVNSKNPSARELFNTNLGGGWLRRRRYLEGTIQS
jgi:hypothetical protein